MKYMKMLGVLAVVAGALMALAGTASASTLTSPTGTTYTGALTATSTNSKLDGAFVTVECTTSHVKAPITQHGAGVTVKGTIGEKDLTFTGCNYPVKVEAGGTLELHAIKKGVSPHATCVAGSYCNGTLTSSGAKVTIETSVGNCTFTTNNTSVGTVTGTDTTGGNAVLDIAGQIPRTAGNFLCGPSGTWTGNYSVTAPSSVTPNSLWIDE